MQPKSAMGGRAIYAHLESFDVKSEYVTVTWPIAIKDKWKLTDVI